MSKGARVRAGRQRAELIKRRRAVRAAFLSPEPVTTSGLVSGFLAKFAENRHARRKAEARARRRL